MPRFHCPLPLSAQAEVRLPDGAAKHVQVLRMQPGHEIVLFNGQGGEWTATITEMGRQHVSVRVVSHVNRECEPVRPVHLAVGMPANDRMDWLVEKATELGVAHIQPLHTAHSVLRLKGDRIARKTEHWQALAASACEQCGGNRIPHIQDVANLIDWLQAHAQVQASTAPLLGLLSLAPGTQPLHQWLAAAAPERPVWLLSGPEGGLSPQEEALALSMGWQAVNLGPRVLRAETAALAALSLATH